MTDVIQVGLGHDVTHTLMLKLHERLNTCLHNIATSRKKSTYPSQFVAPFSYKGWKLTHCVCTSSHCGMVGRLIVTALLAG